MAKWVEVRNRHKEWKKHGLDSEFGIEKAFNIGAYGEEEAVRLAEEFKEISEKTYNNLEYIITRGDW